MKENMTIQNAQIEKAELGFERGTFLTARLFLKRADGFNHTFCGCIMCDPLEDETGKFVRRQGTAYGMEIIMHILKTVGVESWEELKGKYIRIKHRSGFNVEIDSIGNILSDKWFSYKELYKEMYPDREE